MWKTLGIEPTRDLAVIKKAYARQVKRYRPDTHPEQYQSLREAFDQAKRHAKSGQSSNASRTADRPKYAADESTDAPPSGPALAEGLLEPEIDSIATDDPEETVAARAPEPRITGTTWEEDPGEPHESPAPESRNTGTAWETVQEPVEQPPADDRQHLAAAESHMLDIVTTLGEKDDASAILRFDAALADEALQNLEARRHFEALSMEIAVMWPRLDYRIDIPADRAYPISLIEHMIDYFGWAKGETGSDYVEQTLPLCLARLDSATRWRTLLDLAGKIKTRRKNLTDPADARLARLLTSKLKPRRFRMLRFLRSDITAPVDRYLQQLSRANPTAFEHEFDTPAIRWWLESTDDRFNLSMWSIAAILTVTALTVTLSLRAITDWLLYSFDTPPGGFELFSALTLLVTACLVLMLALLYLLYRLRRYLGPIIGPVLNRLREINQAAIANFRFFLSTPPMSTGLFSLIMVSAFSLPLIWPHPGAWIAIGFAGLMYLFRYGFGRWIIAGLTIFLTAVAWGFARDLQQAPPDLVEGWIMLSGVLNTAYLSSSAAGRSARFVLEKWTRASGESFSVLALLFLVNVLVIASILVWFAAIALT